MAGPTPIKMTAQNALGAPNGYGDPNIYINNAAPLVLTADLPAGATNMNGRIIVEDAGGTYNLCYYVAGTVKKAALS